MSDEGHLVFVYGTLRRGASNAFRMEGAEFLREGLVRGRLYRVDWYPAISLDVEAGWVKGELWRIGSEQLAELDQFEGDEYRRIEALVRPVYEDGYFKKSCKGDILAWIWEWKGSVSNLEPLLIGDWLDTEKPRLGNLYTTLGCLGLFAIPIGGLVIVGFIERVIGSSALFESVFAILIYLGTPLFALLLVRCADRRNETGRGWRELTKVLSFVWFTIAVIALVLRFVELLTR